LRGKNLGIDASVIEANASLRALVNRNTEEQYWDYVKRLAASRDLIPKIPRRCANLIGTDRQRQQSRMGQSA